MAQKIPISQAENVGDLEQKCLKHMEDNGFPFAGRIVADGKIHRFSIDAKRNEKDEWYICWDGISSKGNPYLTCIYASWSQGNAEHVFKSWDTSTFHDEIERRELQEYLRKRHLEAEKIIKDDQNLVALEAAKLWAEFDPIPASKEYLAYAKHKGIEPIGAKFGKNPNGYPSLVIYANNLEGEIRTLQYISLGKNGKSYKTFLTGGEKKGNFFLLGEIIDGASFYVVEGYATGVSVHMATKQPVVVAFDCGNIDPVLEKLRKKYTVNEIIIAADDDATGRQKAETAAKKYRCNVIFPRFRQGFILPNSITDEVPLGKIAKDFNDLHFHFGIEETKTQLQVEKITQDSKPTFQPFSFDDLTKMPPKEWLVSQLFGPRDMGMIYGAPGCGKTFMVIDLITKICKGQLWADSFEIVRELNVAYCAGEGISGLPARFKAAVKYHNYSYPTNFTFYKIPPQLYSNDNEYFVIESIINFTNEWNNRLMKGDAEPLDVLVIDTLHTASVGADENSAQDMGHVLKSCRNAAEELGCAVILIHHTNKTGKDERGSSALRGAMDFMIEVKSKGSQDKEITMSCSKLKDGQNWPDKNFILLPFEDSAVVVWNETNNQPSQNRSKSNDKKMILEEMDRNPEIGFTAKSLSEVIGQKQNYANNLLTELVESGDCERELSDPKKTSSNRNPWIYRKKR